MLLYHLLISTLGNTASVKHKILLYGKSLTVVFTVHALLFVTKHKEPEMGAILFTNTEWKNA